MGTRWMRLDSIQPPIYIYIYTNEQELPYPAGMRDQPISTPNRSPPSNHDIFIVLSAAFRSGRMK